MTVEIKKREVYNRFHANKIKNTTQLFHRKHPTLKLFRNLGKVQRTLSSVIILSELEGVVKNDRPKNQIQNF